MLCVALLTRTLTLASSALAADDLHYDGRFRLPNAAAAREVATDPSRVRVKYDPTDPEASCLVLLKT